MLLCNEMRDNERCKKQECRQKIKKFGTETDHLKYNLKIVARSNKM